MTIVPLAFIWLQCGRMELTHLFNWFMSYSPVRLEISLLFMETRTFEEDMSVVCRFESSRYQISLGSTPSRERGVPSVPDAGIFPEIIATGFHCTRGCRVRKALKRKKDKRRHVSIKAHREPSQKARLFLADSGSFSFDQPPSLTFYLHEIAYVVMRQRFVPGSLSWPAPQGCWGNWLSVRGQVTNYAYKWP